MAVSENQAELFKACEQAGIDVAADDDAIVIHELRLATTIADRGSADRELTKLLKHGDALGVPVMITPAKISRSYAGKGGQATWLVDRGFRELVKADPEKDVAQVLIHDPPEKTVKAEIPAQSERAARPRQSPQASAAQISEAAMQVKAEQELRQDPVDDYKDLEIRERLWLARRANEISGVVAGRDTAWLRDKAGRVELGMRQAKPFDELAKPWVARGRNLRLAARQVALDGEERRLRALRDDPERVVAVRRQGRSHPGLDHWARVPYRYAARLDGDVVAEIEAEAGALRDKLEGRNAAELKALRARFAPASVFAPLDRHSGEARAWDVEIRRELIARESMGLADQLGESLSVSLPSAGIDAQGDPSHRAVQLLGPTRAEPLVAQARALPDGPAHRALSPAGGLIWAEVLGDPFPGLDANEALACRRSDRDRRIMLAQAFREDRIADHTATTIGKAAARQHAALANDLREDAELVRTDAEMAAAYDNHVDAWLWHKGDHVGRAIGAGLALARERDQELGADSSVAAEVHARASAREPVAAGRDLGPGF